MNRERLIILVEEGYMTWEDLARRLVRWCSEDDCGELLEQPDFEDMP